MSQDLYRDRILQHYKHPHNAGTLEDPDVTGEATNPNCGDRCTMQARIEGERVTEIMFDGSGCALSVAAASMLTDELRGMPVNEVKKLDAEDVFTLLGLDEDTVSPMRVKCVLLARDAAHAMIGDIDE